MCVCGTDRTGPNKMFRICEYRLCRNAMTQSLSLSLTLTDRSVSVRSQLHAIRHQIIIIIIIIISQTIGSFVRSLAYGSRKTRVYSLLFIILSLLFLSLPLSLSHFCWATRNYAQPERNEMWWTTDGEEKKEEKWHVTSIAVIRMREYRHTNNRIPHVDTEQHLLLCNCVCKNDYYILSFALTPIRQQWEVERVKKRENRQRERFSLCKYYSRYMSFVCSCQYLSVSAARSNRYFGTGTSCRPLSLSHNACS